MIEQIRAMSDEELAKTADTLRRKADLQSALYLADLSVARYEPPSAAVDSVMDRNLMASSRISSMQRMVREEIEARAASGMEARQGGDGETRLHRNDDSPTAASGDAQNDPD